MPSALFTAGLALGAFGTGRLCTRWGRRPGLALGCTFGALGSIGVVAAAATGSVALLLPALLVYGIGTASGLLTRYAGTDLASLPRPSRTGRERGALRHHLGPARLSAQDRSTPARPGAGSPGGERLGRRHGERRRGFGRARVGGSAPAGRHDVAVGATVMVLAQVVMIAVMTMTPVHMPAHGHTVQATGLVISPHVGAMLLPSPLTGLLVDRICGPRPGLNFGLISGTSIVTEALPPAPARHDPGAGGRGPGGGRGGREPCR